MLALWGYQQDQKWIWYTFLVGGIPAFSAAIPIHYVIGYMTFIHLLPAYIEYLLFVLGLIFRGTGNKSRFHLDVSPFRLKGYFLLL